MFPDLQDQTNHLPKTMPTAGIVLDTVRYGLPKIKKLMPSEQAHVSNKEDVCKYFRSVSRFAYYNTAVVL
jgi:hypothetical protein